MNGDVLRLRWSPTGDVLRFTLNNESLHTNSLWEIRADGLGLHELLPGWNLPKWEWMMGWSHDARWFAFSAGHGSDRDIWMLQHFPFSNRPDRGPFQLTVGPIEFDLPVFSWDDKRPYAVGIQKRGELLRLHPGTGTFDPYLGGISADQLDFPRDGQSVTYVTYSEGVLWRSRVNGSDALKLKDTSSRILGPSGLRTANRSHSWPVLPAIASGRLISFQRTAVSLVKPPRIQKRPTELDGSTTVKRLF